MKIKEYLASKGYTYKDFAKIIKTSEVYLFKVSKGYSNPSPAMAGKICIASGGAIKMYEIRKCSNVCQPGCECSKREKC